MTIVKFIYPDNNHENLLKADPIVFSNLFRKYYFIKERSFYISDDLPLAYYLESTHKWSATASISLLDDTSASINLTSICKYLNLNNICSLKFVHNRLTTERIKVIIETLRTNKSLISLDLYGNEIDDDAVNPLLEIIAINNTLKYLCLGNNNITPNKLNVLEKELLSNSPHLVLDMGEGYYGF